MTDDHLIVVLQCDECGEPRTGCRNVHCALRSRPYAGEDVVPIEQLREAEAEVERLREALTTAQGEAYLGTLEGDDTPDPLAACDNVIKVCLDALSVITALPTDAP